MKNNTANILELNMDENKKKALSAALSQIEKQFGKGSVMRLGDQSTLVG
jgi:recombination protein RecA